MGVKLEEPADAADFWTLEFFLRDKKNRDIVVDLGDSKLSTEVAGIFRCEWKLSRNAGSVCFLGWMAGRMNRV